jgi:DNA-binding PucR family transcriptional regulator
VRRLYPRAFFDARLDGLRALVPLATDERSVVERLVRACDELGRAEGLNVGLSDVDVGAASARRRMREAADAASIGRSLAADGGAVFYEQLGAYRYLVHLELDETPHDRYGQAVEELLEYDRRRNTRLVETLERFLGARCSVAASARSLFIHPNTVRQRLERIERITGLDLRQEDLLSLELALKVARLQRVRGE